VAFRTLHLGVLELDTILTLLIVIEFDGLPLVVIVALKTILSELPFVHITVASQTFVLTELWKHELILNTGVLCVEFLSHRNVTLFAVKLLVRAREWVSRLRMIKRKTIIPICGFVAGEAGSARIWIRERRTELALVRSHMTFRTEFLINRFEFINLATVFLMAIETLHFCVSTIQRESSLRVIEGLPVLLRVPAVGRMTLGASLGQELGRELADVWAHVADLAVLFRKRIPMVNANRKLWESHGRSATGGNRSERGALSLGCA
jgi:hypothetical protein